MSDDVKLTLGLFSLALFFAALLLGSIILHGYLNKKLVIEAARLDLMNKECYYEEE